MLMTYFKIKKKNHVYNIAKDRKVRAITLY